MQGCYSPQLQSMNKNSTSFRNSGAYTSPGTPDYGDNNMRGFEKGWCSERVPLPSNSSRRHIGASALMPFNSGRTFPSKWDDAERWITSPVSSFGVCKTMAPPPQRRPKSKSGPLGGTPGVAYFSTYSPAVPMLEGGSTGNFLAGSPLTTGVLAPDGLAFHQAGGLALSTSLPGWSEFLTESPYPTSQDEKLDESAVSRVVSRRDMATQMSPVGSPDTSLKGRSSLSTSPPPLPPQAEPHNHHSGRVEVRDVQIDKGNSMGKQSKRHGLRTKEKVSTEAKDLALSWDTTEGAMTLSKLQKEEARITAWEDLQNAKAEASIRKLEMKLEKKKAASMDKILKKLRVAQMKAQEMRRTMSESAAIQTPRTSLKVVSLSKYFKISLKGCFSCHHS